MIGTALLGENGDRLVVAHLRDWRVRVKLKDELPSAAPVNGSQNVVPSAIGVSVSVALLDAAGAVAKDALGRLLVFDPKVVSFMGDEMAKPDFDPTLKVEKQVLACIDLANAQLPSRDKVNTLLAEWTAETVATTAS